MRPLSILFGHPGDFRNVRNGPYDIQKDDHSPLYMAQHLRRILFALRRTVVFATYVVWAAYYKSLLPPGAKHGILLQRSDTGIHVIRYTPAEIHYVTLFYSDSISNCGVIFLCFNDNPLKSVTGGNCGRVDIYA